MSKSYNEMIMETAKEIIISAIENKHYITQDIVNVEQQARTGEMGERFKILVEKVNEAYNSIK